MEAGGERGRRGKNCMFFSSNNLFLASANFPAVPALQARNQLAGYKSSKTWSKQEEGGGRHVEAEARGGASTGASLANGYNAIQCNAI